MERELEKRQALYVYINRGAHIIYIITVIVSCIGLVLDGINMNSISDQIIFVNLVTGIFILSTFFLYVLKLIKLPTSFAITSYSLIVNFIYALMRVQFGDFETSLFLRNLIFFALLVVITYIIVNKLHGIIQTIIQIVYVITGTIKIENPYLNDSLILSIFILISFSAVILYMVNQFSKNIHELRIKNTIVEDQNELLNKRNKQLTEQKERIKEQAIELIAQKKQLTEINKELENTVATKNKFFSIVAHDLKNPMNSLMGLAELMYHNYQEYDKKTITKYLSIIYKNSYSINELIENLLLWSRMQTVGIKENKTPIFLIEEVKRACKLLESSYRKKEINLLINIDPDIKVYADMFMLSSTLHNLITNAVKFTNIKGSITISAKISHKNMVVISVSDTGIGIAKEDLSKLFQTDHNHTTQGTNHEKGTGLGLLLCKEFVKKNGGKIWVESEVNKGSNFIFTLPLSEK